VGVSKSFTVISAALDLVSTSLDHRAAHVPVKQATRGWPV